MKFDFPVAAAFYRNDGMTVSMSLNGFFIVSRRGILFCGYPPLGSYRCSCFYCPARGCFGFHELPSCIVSFHVTQCLSMSFLPVLDSAVFVLSCIMIRIRPQSADRHDDRRDVRGFPQLHAAFDASGLLRFASLCRFDEMRFCRDALRSATNRNEAFP